MLIEPGQKIPLVAHLECPDGETYFVQAEVLNPSRANITGSPIQLSDEGDGRFFDDSLTMPDLGFLTVTYRVYLDALLTEEALDAYCPKTITITKGSAGSGSPIIITVRDRIIAKTRSNRSQVEIQDPKSFQVQIQDEDLSLQKNADEKTIRTQSNQNKVRTQ